MRRGVTAAEYIRDRITLDGDCWVWRLAPTNHGYATANHGGRKMSAHRLSYIAFTGEIPDGYDVDHLCRNRLCMNPEHLQAVPHRTNVLRGETIAARNSAKTHCPRGHEYTPENTYVYVDKRRHVTQRMCRACIAERVRRKSKGDAG